MAMASRGAGVAPAGDPSSPSARTWGGGDDEAASGGAGKVKLMCSYGGRIAPRPGDGALRYVGGQTRLISVPRAASFGELLRKVEAVDEASAASGGGVLVRYQLPGEDLDSLISVSGPEDYDNMMEEYEKLAAAAPDGSAKLRVFLFPASGTDAAGGSGGGGGSGPHHLAAAAVDESGQRYIDAINCVSAEAMAAAMRRKDSVASAGSSAHNSEASEYSGLVEGQYTDGHTPDMNTHAAILFEEDPSFKDIHRVKLNKGFGEDNVKRQLQAVAEGVAASVLQPPFPEKPAAFSGDHIDSHGAVVDAKVQDEGNNQSDKTSQGVQVLDDIDNLQIIKNSDLEELRELGSGTFGTVYHGKWRGSDVAIKRINDRYFAGKASEQERMRTDFWNEAGKLASLHHPNVVAFYGVVLDGPDGFVATVTEYMANGSLRQALQRHENRIFDRRRRLLIAMDVAFGMEYLHGKNIVHFDLKSDTLLVNLRDPQRPICKVGDLGLSKVKCQTLISGGVRGTLPWMAPELLNGSSSLVSEKVDVFSFGIVMWELLTGEEPYAELHYGTIIGGIVNNTLRPPVPESCDPQWRSLMEQCWSAEPSERPSFTEVGKSLRAMVATPTKAQQSK
ncbi:uncharacterized protein [Miscanthus floridulus]|uniref:uncharacterized protein isoform X3 n=1 Tax=Miscanthus floridulus TaxID=154761 RepID=UPI003459EF81